MASLFKYPGEQEREFRVRSGSKYPHVPDLAYKWLEALYEQGGLPDLSPQEIRIKGRVAVRPVLGDPTNTPADASTHAARLDNGQVVWVKLDERHLSGGHEATYVVEKPASIRAILAALTVLESKETNMETLRRVVPFAEPSHPRSVEASLFEVLRQLPEDEEGADRVWVLLRDLHGSLDYRTVDLPTLNYAVALLRYFRPNFESLPLEERRELLERCCERMNKLLEAARQLDEFLEYGSADRDQRPDIENPRRDVTAAMLRDIEARTYREIAELLEVRISEKSKCVGDYSTIGKMVARGRHILERAFGKENWQSKASMLRARYQRWKSLPPREKFIEAHAENWGVTPERAVEMLEEMRLASGSRQISREDQAST